MTKKWVSIILLIVLIACGVRLFVLPAAKAEGEADVAKSATNYYALTACVVELDRENNMVTVEDGAGNCWQFYGVEDWQTGDCASLLMWDNGTESIFDDEIYEARYSAWTLTH